MDEEEDQDQNENEKRRMKDHLLILFPILFISVVGDVVWSGNEIGEEESWIW